MAEDVRSRALGDQDSSVNVRHFPALLAVEDDAGSLRPANLASRSTRPVREDELLDREAAAFPPNCREALPPAPILPKPWPELEPARCGTALPHDRGVPHRRAAVAAAAGESRLAARHAFPE